jgi:hypothetical protein
MSRQREFNPEEQSTIFTYIYPTLPEVRTLGMFAAMAEALPMQLKTNGRIAKASAPDNRAARLAGWRLMENANSESNGVEVSL